MYQTIRLGLALAAAVTIHASGASALTFTPGSAFEAGYDFSLDPLAPPYQGVTVSASFANDLLDPSEDIIFTLRDSTGSDIVSFDATFLTVPGAFSVSTISLGQSLDEPLNDAIGSLVVQADAGSSFELTALSLTFLGPQTGQTTQELDLFGLLSPATPSVTNPEVAAVPLSGTLALLLSALGGLGVMRRLGIGTATVSARPA